MQNAHGQDELGRVETRSEKSTRQTRAIKIVRDTQQRENGKRPQPGRDDSADKVLAGTWVTEKKRRMKKQGKREHEMATANENDAERGLRGWRRSDAEELQEMSPIIRGGGKK